MPSVIILPTHRPTPREQVRPNRTANPRLQDFTNGQLTHDNSDSDIQQLHPPVYPANNILQLEEQHHLQSMDKNNPKTAHIIKARSPLPPPEEEDEEHAIRSSSPYHLHRLMNDETTPLDHRQYRNRSQGPPCNTSNQGIPVPPD